MLNKFAVAIYIYTYTETYSILNRLLIDKEGISDRVAIRD